MSDIDKRVHYFNGQFLQDKDFKDEQNYHIDRQRSHNRLLHTWGIAGADELKVTAEIGDAYVEVSPGTAFDGEGRQITLGINHQPRRLFVGDYKTKEVYVVIYYTEEYSDKPQGALQETRYHEKPRLALFDIDDPNLPPPETHLRLAKVKVDNMGKVGSHDSTVRRYADVNIQEVAVQKLQIRITETYESMYPTLTATPRVHENLQKGTLSLEGSLSVSQGYILVREPIDDDKAKHILRAMDKPGLLIGCPVVTSNDANQQASQLHLYWTDGNRNVFKSMVISGLAFDYFPD